MKYSSRPLPVCVCMGEGASVTGLQNIPTEVSSSVIHNNQCQIIQISGNFHCVKHEHSVRDVSGNESRVTMVGTPASYSGGPGFKSWPGDRVSRLSSLVPQQYET
jgi:hypothetical protein